MKPLKSADIKGNWATLLLPICKDDSIDFGLLSEAIDRCIAYNVSGIYSNGTAGEFYSQSEEEFDRINEILAEKCTASGTNFQIGVSHMSPYLSRERLKRAILFKPGAVQLIMPDWFPPTMDEREDFLKEMAEIAGDISLVIYTPPHAKVKQTVSDFARLKEAVPTFRGIKIGPVDKSFYDEMKQLAPDVSIFIPGHTLASEMPKGARGAYSNIACLNPGAAQKWYEMMLTDIDEAIQLEKRIDVFREQYISAFGKAGYSNQALDKLWAVVGGWLPSMTTRLRWPYRSVPMEEALRLRPMARNHLPDFFEG
jgi:dihydrodipicolinate synthase/N-acetylneuraminate lyase